MLSGIRLQQKIAPIAKRLQGVSGIPRLSILYLLKDEPMELTDIIHRTRLSPALVAHHLKILLATGWVTRTKYGKVVTYFLHEKVSTRVKLLFS